MSIYQNQLRNEPNSNKLNLKIMFLKNRNKLKGQIIFTASKPKCFDGSKKGRYVLDEHGQWEEPKGFFRISKNYKHLISIQKVKDSIFSRRIGKNGWRLFGYSIKLRLFGRELI